MKCFLIICCSFLLSSNLYSRDLSYKEKIAILAYPKTEKVKDFMISNIASSELSIPDYISFSLLKKSCQPIDHLLKKIDSEAFDFVDQAKMLGTLYHVCSEGTLGLSSLFVKQEI
jgi:hypothetical protein